MEHAALIDIAMVASNDALLIRVENVVGVDIPSALVRLNFTTGTLPKNPLQSVAEHIQERGKCLSKNSTSAIYSARIVIVKSNLVVRKKQQAIGSKPVSGF